MDSKQNSKVHMISLGCPKNLVDGEIMLGSLLKDGYDVTTDAEEANTIIVNTCGFIESAKSESISTILEASNLKKEGKLENLVVTGCLAQRYKDELVKEMPEADLFIGTGEFQNISKILKDQKTGSNSKKEFFNLPTYLQEDDIPRRISGPNYRAYLKISEGCMKRCAFCAIPHIRGDLQSRDIRSVVSEAKLLAAGGVKELIVISHDFSDYGFDIRRKTKDSSTSSNNLLKELSKIEELKWIRVLYLYPDGINDELLDVINSSEKLIPYFDIPLQHINDRVLKLMNRRTNKLDVGKILEKIQTKVPDAIIRTQFIVGFPGETEESFQELLDFVGEQKFYNVGCFKYSPEEGTRGYSLPNQVSEEIKDRRFDQLMSLQREISLQNNRQLIGKVFPVLVEGRSEETELLLQGRSYFQAPDIDGVTYINEGKAEVGQWVKVEITDADYYDLVGRIIE